MSGAKQRLMSEFQALRKEKWVNIEADDLFRWHLGLMVINPDSAFYGGYFKAEIRFSNEYPFKPPTFRFTPAIFHPNIYPDGQICISILHQPGEDIMSGEVAGERWSPLQGVESVLLSVLLLLDNPEISSPANVDASVLYRDHRATYNARAQTIVDRSKKDMPTGFVLPTQFDEAPPKATEDDDAFWADSDEELDFGSDTGDEEQEEDDDEDGEDGRGDDESDEDK